MKKFKNNFVLLQGLRLSIEPTEVHFDFLQTCLHN